MGNCSWHVFFIGQTLLTVQFLRFDDNRSNVHGTHFSGFPFLCSKHIKLIFGFLSEFPISSGNWGWGSQQIGARAVLLKTARELDGMPTTGSSHLRLLRNPADGYQLIEQQEFIHACEMTMNCFQNVLLACMTKNKRLTTSICKSNEQCVT